MCAVPSENNTDISGDQRRPGGGSSLRHHGEWHSPISIKKHNNTLIRQALTTHRPQPERPREGTGNKKGPGGSRI